MGGLLGYSWTIKTRLESCAARSEAFIAKVESAASKQIALNAEETVKRNTITRNLENENVKLQNDVASKYADYRRLLKSSSRSGSMPSVPTTPASGTCGQNEADPPGTVHEFERRIADILEQGDKGIAEAITLEDWMDQQKELEQSSQSD